MNKSKRMEWWKKARFGMFIHWGLYSILGRGEWAMYYERIPKEEYAKLADKFNPTKFNIEEWVKLAKESGMKYMVLTTKHHDGFCLFDSKVSNFTSVKTKAKRDFIEEYVGACRKYKIKIGFYYSLKDWQFAGSFDRNKYPDSFKTMVEQAHGHIKELMSNYGKVDILWYDGLPWINGIAEDWRSKELNDMVRRLQPEIIINNRSGLNEDFDTSEVMIIPSKSAERCWETCMTMGNDFGWGYTKNDTLFKTTPQLIKYLVTVSTCGGNFLLNVGPKPDGTIQKEFISRLKEIGKWLKINGESIYGSDRLYSLTAWGGATGRGNILYLHRFVWAGNTFVLSGLKPKVLSVKILGFNKNIEFETKDNGILILRNLPENPPGKYDTVIKLELEGNPERFSEEYNFPL